MSLLETCEPLFQYVCGVNRAVSKGATLKADTVKKNVKRLLEQVKESCSGSQTLTRQFEEMELPLIFFVDFIIAESSSRFARTWEPLAYERDELAGDDKFFKLLDATLAEPGAHSNELLAVYHTCLGLGFSGIYAGEGPHTEPLRKIRKEVAQRVLGKAEGGLTGHISPQAYKNVDRSDLIEGSGRRIWAMIILLISMIIVLVVINFFQFQWESEEMMDSMSMILKNTGGAPGPAGDGTTDDKGETK